VLRNTFGFSRDEDAEDWSRRNTADIRDPYCLVMLFW